MRVGEYASSGGHKDIVEQLLDWAVRSELLLGRAARTSGAAAGSGQPSEHPPGPNREAASGAAAEEAPGVGGGQGGSCGGSGSAAAAAAAAADGEDCGGRGAPAAPGEGEAGAVDSSGDALGGDVSDSSRQYLQQRLTFREGKILDEQVGVLPSLPPLQN